MCGIVGYVGPREASEFLIAGLRRLEYRGYDSSGVATTGPGRDLTVVKSIGRIDRLAALLAETPAPGCVGIGHTRWATHGVPSDANAHPHVAEGNTLALVHNGVIENFQPLRQRLQGEGYVFRSDTDTEVMVHLIDRCLKRQPPLADMAAARLSAAGQRGASGIGASSRDLWAGDCVSSVAGRDSGARWGVRWSSAWGPASISSPAMPRRWPATPTRSCTWPTTSLPW